MPAPLWDRKHRRMGKRQSFPGSVRLQIDSVIAADLFSPALSMKITSSILVSSNRLSDLASSIPRVSFISHINEGMSNQRKCE